MTQRFAQQIGKVLNSVLITSGLVGGSGLFLHAHATELPFDRHESASQSVSTSVSTIAASQPPLAEGVYLYGEAEEPNQIGAAYLVFEVNGNQTVGAFYMPRSSFDCFQGEFQNDHLNLNVVNSYTQDVHEYSVAVETDSYVASTGELDPDTTQLNGYHEISTVSDNDYRILETCKADLQ